MPRPGAGTGRALGKGRIYILPIFLYERGAAVAPIRFFRSAAGGDVCWLSDDATHVTVSVIIMTYNSEQTIAATLASARRVSDDIHVVDSFSTDRTVEVARRFGANVVQHSFESGGAHRNWAIATLALKYDWQLHLDADERLSDELVDELNELRLAFPDEVAGYYIPRLIHFLGRPVRHGGMVPIWHLRLFRRNAGQCEERRYDQHFYVEGRTRKLKGVMIDDHRMGLSEWTARHNRWADAEADEQVAPRNDGVVRGRIFGNPVEKKRALRGIYNRFPMFLRPFLLFFYRYILRLGFLDGKEGLIFFVLQAFWFWFLVDAKIYERRMAPARRGTAGSDTLER